MTKIETNEILVQTERLLLFLKRNQLVQANAIAQRAGSMLQNVIFSQNNKYKKNEDHPLWPLMRAMARAKIHIINGCTSDALNETIFVHNALPNIKTGE